jgi:hypothetical protein
MYSLQLTKLALLMSAAFALSACQPSRHDVCTLSPNRHSWQGLKVYAEGDIVEVESTDGGGATLFPLRCNIMINLLKNPELYPDRRYNDYSAVALFKVEGQIEYQGGSFVLRPTLLRRTSAWGTEENGGFQKFIKRLRNFPAK